MSLTDLLKEAQQRKKELEAAEEQEKLAKQAELDAKLAIEKTEFETLLKKDAGDIFDHLDEPPTIEPRLNGRTVLYAKVFHRTLVLSMTDGGRNWYVKDELSRQYSQWQSSRFPVENVHIDCDKLSDYLLVRLLGIAKEHEQLLVKIEEEKAKKTKEARSEAKKRETDDRLRLFAEELKALEVHAERVTSSIETQATTSWTWPKDFTLDLNKVSWCTGGYRDADDEETYFDYDSGWSLNDVSVGEPEWFVLLSERNKAVRSIKTSGVITVQRLGFTEETLPDCLFDYPQKVDVEVVDIKFSDGYFEHRYRLLPELVPPLPEGCAVSVKKVVVQAELKRLPILEVRRAIDKLSAEPTSKVDTDPWPF